MKLDELTRANASIIKWLGTRGMSDKDLAAWLSRMKDAKYHLEMSCSDGGGLEIWRERENAQSAIDIRSSKNIGTDKEPEYYATDGVYCHCTAFANDKPCWHRAAYLIIRHWQKTVKEEEEEAKLAQIRQVRTYFQRLDNERMSADERAERLRIAEERGDELF